MGRERTEEERERAVKDFEEVMMGLERKKGSGRAGEEGEKGRGVKRKFELDEEEMLRNAREERGRARRAIDDEKVGFCSTLAGKGSMLTALTGRQTKPPLLLGSFADPFNKRSCAGESIEAIACVSRFGGKEHTSTFSQNPHSHYIYKKQ